MLGNRGRTHSLRGFGPTAASHLHSPHCAPVARRRAVARRLEENERLTAPLPSFAAASSIETWTPKAVPLRSRAGCCMGSIDLTGRRACAVLPNPRNIQALRRLPPGSYTRTCWLAGTRGQATKHRPAMRVIAQDSFKARPHQSLLVPVPRAVLGWSRSIARSSVTHTVRSSVTRKVVGYADGFGGCLNNRRFPVRANIT